MAGDAYSGQDPPAGFLKAGFGTPSLPRGPVGGRIQCAAHRPLREGVVTHSVVVRQIKQARQVNSHIVEISCQDRPRRAAGCFPGMQELARIAPRTCLESFWTSEYLPETSYRCPEAFSASLRNIPGMPQEPPARSQDAPEIQKMISESLRARPQDPSGMVFDNFCELFALEPSFAF